MTCVKTHCIISHCLFSIGVQEKSPSRKKKKLLPVKKQNTPVMIREATENRKEWLSCRTEMDIMEADYALLRCRQ